MLFRAFLLKLEIPYSLGPSTDTRTYAYTILWHIFSCLYSSKQIDISNLMTVVSALTEQFIQSAAQYAFRFGIKISAKQVQDDITSITNTLTSASTTSGCVFR